ncbi:methyltransferase domain-containing protein [Streptomonospora salina]|uniref:Protein-L-isoaspartate O-methyltransferase n=1 Tax=Streptomonospora salina TaxID=104205 RepID=A0A841E6Y7_9ACTN|nr:methyltransferase domain-containing protein [Streptomonospora salina]MBB5998776.1 protein-L-isoaspartate(D-aspartate) O-methyltransferase [Streptomonospora salina]
MATGPDDLAHLVHDWSEESRAALREHFIPEAAWASPLDSDPGYWIDRTADPDRWRSAVYSDTTILTQVDDGGTALTEETATAGSTPSSSSTAPSLVAAFLRMLDPYPGDRVLEVGTGTGWTAALLSARLGVDGVVSVEVDDQVAKHAAVNLERAGFAPHLVVGDGADGWPERAPYDRVHVTCGVATVPYAWVAQTRPGGVLAVPWAPNHVSGHRLALTSTGNAAVGRIRGDTSFMMLRSQRLAYPPPADGRRESAARVDPRRIGRAGRGMEVALAGFLPGVLLNAGLDGADQVGVRDPGTRSYAIATGSDGGWEVVQIGPRSLWEELETAYLAWVEWGCPDRGRFGVTVDAAGQHVWLDRPDNRLAPLEVRADG